MNNSDSGDNAENRQIVMKRKSTQRLSLERDDEMIHYHLWLSNDPTLRRIKAHQNDASAARIYGGLKPLRLAFGCLLSALQNGLRTWRALSRRKTATQELLKLDDRLLKDIGVSRGQIPGIVRAGSRGTQQDLGQPDRPIAGRPSAGSRQACKVIVLDTARQSTDGQMGGGKMERMVRRGLTAA